MNHRIATTAVLLLFFAPAAAAAQQQSSTPPGFVYNVKMGSGGQATGFSLAFTVQPAASDGSRNANIVVKWPQMKPLDGKKLDATIAPSGAVTLGSTGDVTKHYSPAQAAQMSQAATGPMLQMFLNPLNAFATAVAAAPSQKIGTSWHGMSVEQIDVLYTITAREQQGGRDTLVVKLSNPSTSGPGYTGQGYYDLGAHMVVNLHSEMRQTTSGPAQVFDVVLGGS